MSTMMTLHMEDGGGPPVESSCGLGVVEPLDGGLLVASARDIGLQRLADADGRPCGLSEYLERPSGFGGLPGERKPDGRQARVRVARLDDQRDQRCKDVVAAAAVECVRLIGGRDAQYEQSVVLARPQLAEVLEMGSDAFAPVLGERRDPLDHYAVSFDDLRALVAYREPVLLGVLFVWHDERASYQVVAGPRPYKRRPEQVVGVGSGIFDALVPAMLDLFGEQPRIICACISSRATTTRTVPSGMCRSARPRRRFSIRPNVISPIVPAGKGT